MKLWKVIGYLFAGVGILLLCYGFFVAFTDTINPSTIFSGSSNGLINSSIDSFFSVFLSAIAPWLILSLALFVIGGIGLYVGRAPKIDKGSIEEELNRSRIDLLEKTVDRNYKALSKRLEAIEKQLKELKNN